MSTLSHLLLIAVAYAIVNNVVLSQFLGICPFLGVSKKTETAAGMGGAVVFVITISSFVTALIYKYILANSYLMSKGIDLTYLQTIVFILVIAALVQFVEMFLKKQMPPLYKAMPSHGKEEYLYDDKALEKYRKIHKEKFTLQRYKGLGEMDPEQLWETTLNPETRLLKRVEIEDARMASDVTEVLMGTEVPPRKAFIYEHATDAELDI